MASVRWYSVKRKRLRSPYTVGIFIGDRVLGWMSDDGNICLSAGSDVRWVNLYFERLENFPSSTLIIIGDA